MASSSFPQEKSVATHHTTWETLALSQNIALNDFRLCWRWWWRDSLFFRGAGRFNDILAIVWHVIVKFLCRREQSTRSETGVGTEQWLGEAAREHRCTGQREEEWGGRKSRWKKMICIDQRERVLEVDKNIVLHNVSDLNTDGCRLWNENQILYIQR